MKTILNDKDLVVLNASNVEVLNLNELIFGLSLENKYETEFFYCILSNFKTIEKQVVDELIVESTCMFEMIKKPLIKNGYEVAKTVMIDISCDYVEFDMYGQVINYVMDFCTDNF